MSDLLERVVVWRSWLISGVDRCELHRTGQGFSLTGTALGLHAGMPVRARYQVHCDRRWRTRRVQIDQELGKESRRLSLSVEPHGHWQQDGKELPGLAGCVDVDLAITPATNTLPIRRLALALGQGQDVTAAWVKFPELLVEPLRQTYTRNREFTYRYKSGSGFVADLVVDEFGLVISYPGGWERLGSG